MRSTQCTTVVRSAQWTTGYRHRSGARRVVGLLAEVVGQIFLERGLQRPLGHLGQQPFRSSLGTIAVAGPPGPGRPSPLALRSASVDTLFCVATVLSRRQHSGSSGQMSYTRFRTHPVTRTHPEVDHELLDWRVLSFLRIGSASVWCSSSRRTMACIHASRAASWSPAAYRLSPRASWLTASS